MLREAGEDERQVIEEWFARRGFHIEYEIADGGRVLGSSWMAIVRHAAGRPAYVTGYGETKPDAARSACHRLLRRTAEEST